ncbi:isomerase [Lysobacter helvus]|uniref:2-hydroxychromene-2-carboxylate isomerase n=2 Tax=Lysobacteraceae TaxID=32033 RepID=A0ABM7Q563_9GAMM|nr:MULTISPECIES: 2-hydroxychromene-2-carboxylate isomerase [Lysobacter]BCT92435.1 isomerase [Lysobacter caseinilyticus]BCT95588.1 isomerase [Lysobacter helvus]
MDARTPLRWYFDFLSPFSYLHWQKVKALRATHAIEPVPVLFGVILDAHGQKGPAEIPGKREFTYRHVLWQARQEGVPLVFPPRHPFNPLGALRACIAAGSTFEAVDAIFDWIWRDGRAVDSPEAIAPLLARLGVDADALGSAPVKEALRANTEAAVAAGVFGVPTLQVGGQLFWGNDAHPFALAALQDAGVLDDPEMQRVSALPVGISRRP